MRQQNSVSSLRIESMTKTQAGLLIRRMLGSYHSQSLHDPEIYMTELVSVLLRYPFEIGERGTRQAKMESPKFIPSVPEVERACEALIAPRLRTLTYAQEWEERTARQLEERRQIEQQNAALSDEQRQQIAARFMGELAAHGFPVAQEKQFEPSVEAQATRKKYGLSDEQWDAIPDAPKHAGYWQGLRQTRG